MSSKDDNILKLDPTEPVQPSVRPWSPDELVPCANCRRANAPTRANCLYCGATLPVTEKSAALRRPTLRPLERGELGFNAVLTGPIKAEQNRLASSDQLEQMAELLQLQVPELQTILAAEIPLPLARVHSYDEAALIVSHLGKVGLTVEIVPDEFLTAEANPPFRLRSLEFTEKSVVGLSLGEMDERFCAWPEIVLCVVGRIFTRRMEVEERKARGPENEIIDARELEADEIVIDLYTVGEDANWRISSHNFDFSCLGKEKALTVAENVSKLTRVIRGFASEATFDDSYKRWRQAIQPVWPITQHTESRGWRRTRLGGGFSTEAATISNNLFQFTSYSRLRYYFALKERGLAPNTINESSS